MPKDARDILPTTINSNSISQLKLVLSTLPDGRLVVTVLWLLVDLPFSTNATVVVSTTCTIDIGPLSATLSSWTSFHAVAPALVLPPLVLLPRSVMVNPKPLPLLLPQSPRSVTDNYKLPLPLLLSPRSPMDRSRHQHRLPAQSPSSQTDRSRFQPLPPHQSLRSPMDRSKPQPLLPPPSPRSLTDRFRPQLLPSSQALPQLQSPKFQTGKSKPQPPLHQFQPLPQPQLAVSSPRSQTDRSKPMLPPLLLHSLVVLLLSLDPSSLPSWWLVSLLRSCKIESP
jgi:hypothetical protein